MINWVLFVFGVVLKGLDHFWTYMAITTTGARELAPVLKLLTRVVGLEGAQIIVGVSWVIVTFLLALNGFTVALGILVGLLILVLVWNTIQFFIGLKKRI
jgi:hypothetical protein